MNELTLMLRDLNEKKVYEIVEEMLKANIPVTDIISSCNEGMAAVGELFSKGNYFISQLLYSAEIMKNVMKRLEPLMEKTAASPSSGKVVIGTVKGDIHDIGKNIVVTLLKGSGFEVIDLGVDVPAESFVKAVEETGAKILGLSALLNFTYPEMKGVIDALINAGLRENVKVIIGGTPCNEQVRDYVGADYYAEDAVVGVNICRHIYGV